MCSAPATPIKNTEDAALMARISGRRDDDELFATLYSSYAEAAFALALSLTCDRALAEDAVQESMLRIWCFTGSSRPSNVRGWVLRIVWRECVRLAKRRKRERLRTAKCVISHETVEPGAIRADREALLSTLRAVLAELAQPDRRLLELYFSNGLSQRQIGAALAIPQQSISYRIRQVLSHVRSRLAAC